MAGAAVVIAGLAAEGTNRGKWCISHTAGIFLYERKA